MPDAPVLVTGPRQAVLVSLDGEVMDLTLSAAAEKAADTAIILCDGAATSRRLGAKVGTPVDVLELYAFVRPAAFCLPTPGGIAAAMGIPPSQILEDQALGVLDVCHRLLTDLGRSDYPNREETARLAMTMARAGWPWGTAVLSALGVPQKPAGGAPSGLDVWNRLPEWDERPPEPAVAEHSVPADDARNRLQALLDPKAEVRPQQSDYAAGIAPGFAPRSDLAAPNVVLAEAGTGVGKTLGYIAPASLWAEHNQGAVWISTYTKNLQRQIDQELSRLYPDPVEKARKAVIRKGRENYLCLLNFEEAVGRAGATGATVALALLARWARHSRDGDMVGGDFPAWLGNLGGSTRLSGLTDRRGECIYSACTHYRKCFIERAVRRARKAEIVVANHALVMTQAVSRGHDLEEDGDRGDLPTHYVFDEGHHVFDAADSAFSACLSGLETAELRRWIRGPEGQRARRGRGLEKRVGDLVAGNGDAEAALHQATMAAASLPDEGWLNRVAGDGAAKGPAEQFLRSVHDLVLARNPDQGSFYGLEAANTEPPAGLTEAAELLGDALQALVRPLTELARTLEKKLIDEADELDAAIRGRIEAVTRSLRKRIEFGITPWRNMLTDIGGETPDPYVDWFSVARRGGRDSDVGFHRHWIDPTEPFTTAVLDQCHGAVITSATLRDQSPDTDDDWASAEVRTGAHHLVQPPARLALPSPFDYPNRTRVLVVTDVRHSDPDQLAAAYRELFRAADGGALGLFTSIARLRAVHEQIAAPLDDLGLPLYAQHVDAMDTGTLVDIFRAEEDACLLGTDAVRDGVDVPGRSLRLMVYDRVPWPRPDLLHRARKKAFGSRAYDDMLTRLRLKQAYGRLLRHGDDRGVFVMLDSRMPSRLATAFPEGVTVERVGLAEAIAETAAFIGSPEAPF
jgi:ATP-dependent DNA helicase DinG